MNHFQINHGHEDKNNGAYGSRCPIRHMLGRPDMIIDGRVERVSKRMKIKKE